jgi:hypothetical protein
MSFSGRLGEVHLGSPPPSRRKSIEADILESKSDMERHLEAELHNVPWPRETRVSFDVSPDGSSVALDVDLPELGDMPACTAMASQQKLYVDHVHGVGFRMIAEAFAALPTVRQVTLCAYSRRADPTTGKLRDDYLYAVRVQRDDWAAINFDALAALDVTLAMVWFDLRRKMTNTGTFIPIEPFEPSSSRKEHLEAWEGRFAANAIPEVDRKAQVAGPE